MPFVNKILEFLISVQQMLNFACLIRKLAIFIIKKIANMYSLKLRNSLEFEKLRDLLSKESIHPRRWDSLWDLIKQLFFSLLRLNSLCNSNLGTVYS